MLRTLCTKRGQEHGTRYRNANATNNHPILIGAIVLAHLEETLDYYDRLDVAELEGDILKAVLTDILINCSGISLAKHALATLESRQIRTEQ